MSHFRHVTYGRHGLEDKDISVSYSWNTMSQEKDNNNCFIPYVPCLAIVGLKKR